MKNKIVRLTLAQWRMLGRMVRGEVLPTDRFHGRTVQALSRKGCAGVSNGAWFSTEFGDQIYVRRGFWHPDFARVA